MKCWVAKDHTKEVFAMCHANVKTLEEFKESKQKDGREDIFFEEMDSPDAIESMRRWKDIKAHGPREGKISFSDSFKNEKDKEISIQADLEGDNIRIVMESPDSKMDNTITKQEGMKLIEVISKCLMPTGKGRVETIVFESDRILPDWLMKAHMEKDGCFGIRIRSLAIGDALNEHEQLMEKLTDAWDKYRESGDDRIGDRIDELLGFD